MPGYLIYLPGRTGANPQHLVDVGLAGLVASENKPTVEFGDVMANGPDGSGGVVCRFFSFKHPERSPRLGVFPDQEWTQGQGGAYWLGRCGAIAPEDLARPSLFESSPASLADGQEWLIPIGQRLPHKWGLDAQGVFARSVRTEFQGYFDRAAEYRECFLGSSATAGDVLTFAGAWEFACQALSLNYLVTPEIIAWLGLIDDRCWVSILGAAGGLVDAV